MPGSVIVGGARTPIGKLSGALAGFTRRWTSAASPSRRRCAGRYHRRPGRLRVHGPGAPGRRRADHRPPGRGQGRHPDDRARDDDQQGVPLRAQRDLPRRPDDRGRRGRRRRRRRHGVDDQRPLPAARGPRRLPLRRQQARRLDVHDGLFCAFDQRAHGRRHRELQQPAAGISREEQDELAAKSHERAARPRKNGLFDDEIVPVEVPQRKGDPIVVADDEGVRAGHHRRVAWPLRPAFAEDGTITAGNASQISDGARRGHRHVAGPRPRSSGVTARRDRRHGMVAGPDAVAAHPAVQRDPQGARAGRA